MPGTVKSGLLADTVRLCKCDSQEIDCWTLILTLDRGHFITDYPVHTPVRIDERPSEFLIRKLLQFNRSKQIEMSDTDV
jgi:hypothetical protein